MNTLSIKQMIHRPLAAALLGALQLAAPAAYAATPDPAPQTQAPTAKKAVIPTQPQTPESTREHSEDDGTPPGKAASTMDMDVNMDMAKDKSMSAEPQSAPTEQAHAAMQMGETPTPMDKGATPMDMGAMQGGAAPAGARDPDAWADGYEYTGMAGFEKTDQIPINLFLLDEFEFVSGNEGDGGAWTLQAAHGGDVNKLWVRSQGLKVAGQPIDPTSSAELLWWRGFSPFFGSVLGVRQDLGAGAHTWLAFGIEGLMPYWFEVEATGYLAEDGRLAARLKGSYDLRFTNRLVLTPGVETNFYSRLDPARGLGSGLGNVEIGLRLRYVVQRKFAPYVGYVWERSFGGTAELARASGEPLNERRFVAGMRMWW